ncbi:MAG: MerR family DNA-binding protein, partial [Armatimonadota bacterium]
ILYTYAHYPEEPRKPSGYRQYSEDVIPRLRFIRRAKELGFSLDEIGELLSLRVDSAAKCADVKQRAEAKIVDLDERISALARMRETLAELVAACDARAPTSECPILEALEAEEEEKCRRWS